MNKQQSSKMLNENEIKLSQIIQANPIPTFVIDSRHVITHWNEACTNLTGIPAGDMIGTRNQWMAFYSEPRHVLADLLIDNTEERKIEELYKGNFKKSDTIKDGYNGEDFFPAIGERGKWLFFTAAPLRDTDGKINGAIETFQDISQRKENEARFRDLVENILVGISIIQDGEIVYQNPEQEKFLGPLPRVAKLTDFESIHPDDVGKVKKLYQKLTSEKIQSLEVEFRFYPVDEHGNRLNMKWVHCRAGIIEYQGRDAILVNMIDVTYTKELESVLRIQDKMSSLGRVAAGIAHEIRNPLSGINIYLNTMERLYEKGDKPEQLKQIFKQIQSASNKIESVIRRVMDFSKPGEPNFVYEDINKPIEEAINLSSVTLRKRGIKLEKDLAKDMPKCKADPQMIEQVILNLITNAAEAMKNIDTEKKVGVTSDVENNRIIVKIYDSGPGVPLSLREKIFDPFYTTKNGGTGIGLSLCKRVIKDHDGSLNVYSGKWDGAEFRIELPLEEDEDETC